jgi:hypothetical protein
MKRTLLLFVLLSSLHSARASDTLIVRDVFNFSIGDTFNYRLLQGETSPIYHYNYTYWTNVIVGKDISPGNDTISYTLSRDGLLETFIVTHLDSTVISYTDTPVSGPNCLRTFTKDSSSTGFSNTVRWGCDFNGESYKYMRGLGLVYKTEASDWNMGGTYTALVSYIKNGVTDTTSYIRLATNDMEDINSVLSLFPNPANTLVNLSLVTANHTKTVLILTDLLGQQVYTSTISEIETTHDISSLPSGIYTWRIVSENTILKTGKIVKQ